jgi:hypothetical protein
MKGARFVSTPNRRTTSVVTKGRSARRPKVQGLAALATSQPRDACARAGAPIHLYAGAAEAGVGGHNRTLPSRGADG